jgi:hypothetical protein
MLARSDFEIHPDDPGHRCREQLTDTMVSRLMISLVA